MDCTQAKQVLTDRYASDLMDAHDLDAALTHCEECLDCAMYARALASLDAIPRPTAPDKAVRQALDAVEAARAAAAQELQVTPADVPDGVASTPEDIGLVPGTVDPYETGGSRLARLFTGQRFGVIAAAAAVFAVAVFGGVQLLDSGMGGTATEEDQALSDQPMGSILDEEAAAERAEEAAPAPDFGDDGDTAAVAAAPPYVVFDGVVHTVATEAELGLTSQPIGQVTTAKDLGGSAPRLWDVLEEGGALYLEGSDLGYFARITAVTRVYGGRTFALVADQPVASYGEWPGLPTSIPEPSTADGAPVLAEAGADARSATIYARIGTSPQEGFAIAPGQPVPDPAAGNPNWTWWEPYDE